MCTLTFDALEGILLNHLFEQASGGFMVFLYQPKVCVLRMYSIIAGLFQASHVRPLIILSLSFRFVKM